MNIRLIDVYIYEYYYHQVPILARASHFGYEHASHEIFREIICSHTWMDIFLYYALLFLTVKKFGQHNNKFWGYELSKLCYNTHDIIFF